MHHKKLYLILLIAIVIFGALLFKEIKKAANITVKKATTPIISKGIYDIPIYTTDQIYGNPGAAVTVIEFTDFNCVQCAKIHDEVIGYIDKNPQAVRLVWKGFPKPTMFTTGNPLPHRAALCAAAQNKFWQFAKLAMQNKKSTTEDGLKKIAQGLGLDTAKWWSCYSSTDTAVAIASSTRFAQQMGIGSLIPTVFINNRWINTTNDDINIEDMLKQFVNSQ